VVVQGASAEELRHGFLWRTTKAMPGGDRSAFSTVRITRSAGVRVHPQILETQKLPKRLVTKHIWQERFEDINNFERYAARNGIAVVKFFLHLSKEEQKRGFWHGWRLRKELEVFFSGRQERGFWMRIRTLTRRRSGTRRASLRPGMLCRRITNGLRDWWFHTRWWRRCRDEVEVS